MAFLDCRDAADHALPGFATTNRAGTAPPDLARHFAPDELRIVEMARGDTLESLRVPGKRGWFARLVLGPQPPSPSLANERLEALRRLVVHAWHEGYRLPASALKGAEQAGFSEDQVGALVDSIGRARSARRLAPL
ncbi:hypothetical protein [Novosphingobium sp. MBES04]|uniref:hypothetical protein n=1 Tax=Novosphingobium sp. MBES04 TaxID=1206458 RepID=UPI00057C9292|nr:hypothetical protein [Novosphingobium sp. MBES04]GAM04021.1 hypothetical conserved protein [Novosphingobium sp. MBES04]